MKNQKFNELPAAESAAKQKEMMRQLVEFKLSLDPSKVSYEGGLSALQRDYKQLARHMAQVKAKKES